MLKVITSNDEKIKVDSNVHLQNDGNTLIVFDPVSISKIMTLRNYQVYFHIDELEIFGYVKRHDGFFNYIHFWVKF